MLRFRGALRTLLHSLLLSLVLLLCSGIVTEAAPQEDPVEAEEAQDLHADSALAAALVEAAETDRLVFLHTGADW